ncbi:MAG TPA: DNA-directed RNA polymerase subunit alpha [Caldisericia bacterium]|nr:DNA-directed RNA polymerase subunit alpha [Caldisericia bacterium]HPB33824.1 DNA-directed RNA polymerase subunit alpha [Caldisericia bacterium]HQL66589.1 DNA-directed RNA polymerase subunit alpha [Caldisericia bacterium]HQP00047.1 DNA-directed RNA polymerase subunit alpha [Caldisericia bacterium]
MEYLAGKPKIKLVGESNNYLKIILDPLYKGYGITIGNLLRRILLSSIMGYGIYAIEIKGVSHEFSTINNVYEDIPEIIYNIKQIVIRGKLDRDKIHLFVKGEKDVKAGDFDPNPNLEIVNPDLHLFSITDKKGEVEMVAHIKRGFGYLIESENKEPGFPINTIFIDTNFSPVKKVNFEVSSSDVAPFPKREKLTLEIYTNGSLSPREILRDGIRIVSYYMDIIGELKVEEEKKEVGIELLPLSSRIKKILLNEGINNVNVLKKELLSGGLKEIKGIGDKYIEEIEEILKSYSEEKEEETFLERNIEELASELSISMEDLNILKLGGIKTLRDLVNLSINDLMSERFNLSQKVVKKIESKLKKWNLSLRKESNNET